MHEILTDLPDDELLDLVHGAALARLTGGALHTLGNELFGILANVELVLLDAPADARTRERLQLAHESGLELRETLRLLGVVARGEAGTPDAVEAVRRTTRVGSVELSWPEEPPTAGVAAEVASALVLHALLAGVDAAGRGGALTVAAEREGSDVVLRVRPSGAVPRAAAALAERHGGSLAVDADGALRLSLPAA